MRLGDFIDINPSVKLDKGEEYPFVDMETVTPGRRYVTSTKKREFKGGGSKFNSGDTLFARITPCLENGKIAQFIDLNNQPGLGSSEFFVFRAIKDISIPAFVYYLAWTELIRKPAEKSMSGASGRQRADMTVIKNIRIPQFTVQTQEKIAAILSAYDDLIENNGQRIKTLENMAQVIYKEWFVNLRFPGHKKIKMVKSKLGMIPDEWEVVKSSDAIVVNPSIKVDKNIPKPYVDMGGLSEASMIIEPKEQRTGSNGSKYQNGDTLFARITPCLENGKTGFVQFLAEGEEGIGSTEFIVLRSKSLSPEFVYFLARSEDFRNNAIKSMTGASGRQRVQSECFNKYLLAQPRQNILDKFTEIVRPMFQSIFQLDSKNKNLRKTRDLLLPKLISGEIDLEGLQTGTGQ
jgi:type I restriction enzyme S subunit